MTLMEQGGRKLLHLINVAGHSQTGYFAPVPMRGIEVEVAGKFSRARAVRKSRELVVRQRGEYSGLSIPELEDYEVVVLE
jgi:hypothetical protein